jgi:hypothetical protein
LPFMNMLVCRAKLERHLRLENRVPHGAQAQHSPRDGDKAPDALRRGSDPQAQIEIEIEIFYNMCRQNWTDCCLSGLYTKPFRNY